MPDPDFTKSSILVVDDEEEHAQVMCEALARVGHQCDVTHSLEEATHRLAKRRYDVIVTDLVMEGRHDGLELLKVATELEPSPPVILVTAHGDVPTAVKAMNEGAYSFIEKPLDLEYFRAQVNRAAEKAALQRQNQVLQEQLEFAGGFEGIVGNSGAMRQVVTDARRVAASEIPVLITGESGTGKELVARAIHNNSRRRRQRLVTMNCAGMPESILEDELFGHVRGAYTGAQGDREGRFEYADGGTLFMDEIGDMPGNMQAKLLRVLENGEVVRLGSNASIQVDVRLISATNKNLAEMVEQRHFREDLYFRIKGVEINIPPLRERREDIPLLAHHFLLKYRAKVGKPGVEGFTPPAMERLLAYQWPGNVRELENKVHHALVLAQGDRILPDVVHLDVGTPTRAPALDVSRPFRDLKRDVIEAFESEYARELLRRHAGNLAAAARQAGIDRKNLWSLVKKYGIDVDGFRRG
jgi:DNA-binding NtrC family response regulator